MNRISDPKKLHPLVQIITECVLAECRERGWQVGLFETLRTKERQQVLLEDGNSWTMNSYHRVGLAIDVVFKPNGNWSWANEHPWDDLAAVFEKYGLYSLWKNVGKDGPHAQLNVPGYSAGGLIQKMEEFDSMEEFYSFVTEHLKQNEKLTTQYHSFFYPKKVSPEVPSNHNSIDDAPYSNVSSIPSKERMIRDHYSKPAWKKWLDSFLEVIASLVKFKK